MGDSRWPCPSEKAPRAAVFAPSPLLTVSIETRGADPELHLHAGGQGFWQARMIAAFGVRVTLCGSFGGETGEVVHRMMEVEGVEVHRVDAEDANPAQVNDRRSGERETIVRTPLTPLSRHEADELYGAMLVEGLDSDVCLLAGTASAECEVVPADTYRRLAADLMANGATVVADLSGAPLEAVLEAGVSVLKVSDEELERDGRAKSRDVADVVAAIEKLCGEGADVVVVSRAEEPSIATVDGELVEIVTPHLEAVQPKGAGDSMTAAIAASLALGRDLPAALRLGAAAGALNVTRRGLGTGGREEIERLAEHVGIRPMRAGGDAP
jgi:1-phosphofructokinase